MLTMRTNIRSIVHLIFLPRETLKMGEKQSCEVVIYGQNGFPLPSRKGRRSRRGSAYEFGTHSLFNAMIGYDEEEILAPPRRYNTERKSQLRYVPVLGISSCPGPRGFQHIPTWVESLEGGKLPDYVVHYLPERQLSLDDYRGITAYDTHLPTVILSTIATYLEDAEVFRLLDGVSLPLQDKVQYDMDLSSTITTCILTNDDVTDDFIWAMRRASAPVVDESVKVVKESGISRLEALTLLVGLERDRTRIITFSDIRLLLKNGYGTSLQRLISDNEGRVSPTLPLRPTILYLIKIGEFTIIWELTKSNHPSENALLHLMAEKGYLHFIQSTYSPQGGCHRPKLSETVPMRDTILRLIQDGTFHVVKQELRQINGIFSAHHSGSLLGRILTEGTAKALEVFLCEETVTRNEKEIEDLIVRAIHTRSLEKVEVVVETFFDAIVDNWGMRRELEVISREAGLPHIHKYLVNLMKRLTHRRFHLKSAGRKLWNRK